jgi:hypothetical protein
MKAMVQNDYSSNSMKVSQVKERHSEWRPVGFDQECLCNLLNWKDWKKEQWKQNLLRKEEGKLWKKELGGARHSGLHLISVTQEAEFMRIEVWGQSRQKSWWCTHVILAIGIMIEIWGWPRAKMQDLI